MITTSAFVSLFLFVAEREEVYEPLKQKFGDTPCVALPLAECVRVSRTLYHTHCRFQAQSKAISVHLTRLGQVDTDSVTLSVQLQCGVGLARCNPSHDTIYLAHSIHAPSIQTKVRIAQECAGFHIPHLLSALVD